VGRHLVGLADMRGRVGLAVRDRVDPVGLAVRGRADLAVRDRVGLVGRHPVGQDMDRAAPVDQADLVARVDRHRRRTRHGVRTTGVAPRWAAPGMYLTASALPVTVRRLRPHNTDGGGMAGLHPERRRLSGTDRRPRVAGTVHRLRVVGTAHGTVQRVTLPSRSRISDRSTTTGTTRSRCSIRFLGDGASGSLVSGSRCTDTT
jgi:hypothetical protein